MRTWLAGLLVTGGCGIDPLPRLADAHRDYSGVLPVFPGAEGFGTDTRAGRGGTVLVVDTLHPDGPGSLRWPLEQDEPRTIVFEVGGVIEVDSWLEVRSPFVTLAGQTAPDPGITLYGAGLRIQTHDVLVQHIAVRAGDRRDGPDPDDRDSLQIIGDPRGETRVCNVVIDHVSLSWGIDETFSTYYPGVCDVTVSHSLISESLDDSLKGEPHSKAFLVGDHTRRLAMLRNVLAHSDDRHPVLKGDTTALVVNNFVYDPGRWPVTFFDQEDAGPMLTSLLGNDFVYGASSPKDHHTILVSRSVKDGSKLFLEDNRGWDLRGDQSSLVDAENGAGMALVAAAPVSVTPLTVAPVEGLEPSLLETAGSRPAARDAVDQRVIASIRERAGRIIDAVREVGFPKPEPTRVALDLPEDPSGDLDGDGYTNLENWLHALSARAEGR